MTSGCCPMTSFTRKESQVSFEAPAVLTRPTNKRIPEYGVESGRDVWSIYLERRK